MILGVSGGPSGAPNRENVIKNSVLFRKYDFLPHFGGPDPPFFQKVQVRVRGSRGGSRGSPRVQNGVKSRVCSVNSPFSWFWGSQTRGRPGGHGGSPRVKNGVKSRVCSVNLIFSEFGTPKIRGPGGVSEGQKGGKIKVLFRKQPFFGVLGGSRGSWGPQNDPFMTQ